MLRVDGLGRRYRRRGPWAIRDLSIECPAGSITALIGPNGAGKSTLLRSCIGFERPDEGSVHVNGVDPARNRASAVQSAAYLPQTPALYRGLTVGNHLTFAADARRSFDHQYAVERLAQLRLFEDQKISNLSGGQQAQVALAVALGTRAPLLLLDEPLANLDPLARREFLAVLLESSRTDGTTAVLSSHIVADIEQACDRIVVIVNGRLALEAGISEAKAEHSIVAASGLIAGRAVGVFAGPHGESLALLNDGRAGRPASLEEIVFGYLSSEVH